MDARGSGSGVADFAFHLAPVVPAPKSVMPAPPLAEAIFEAAERARVRVCDLLSNRPMRRIKLSGREHAVLKALGFANAVLGSEVLEHTQMQLDDMTDVLNALLTAGYVESKPYREQITAEEMPTTEFEVNPGYVHELKAAMARSWA